MKRINLLTAILCLVGFASFGQIDPNNIPKPPTDKLKIFEPYFGNYEQTMDYAGMKFKGTMEIKTIVKGWYVDWTIYTKSLDNRIDREYHMIVTYDTRINKYRIWRFETLPFNNNEISLYTQGEDIIVEMIVPNSTDPSKPATIFYNRYSKPASDQIKIITQTRSLDGKVLKEIGVATATKTK